MITYHSTRTSTKKFVKPSEESLQRVINALREAGKAGLTFSELVEKTGLSRDTVNRCLIYLVAQGIVEKREGRWFLRPRSLALIDEVEVWLEKIETLDEELFAVMLKRLEGMKGEVRTEECVKLAERVAAKIDEWKGDYGILEKILSIIELLPDESLRHLMPSLKSILEDFLRRCPRRYVVEGDRLLQFHTLNHKPSLGMLLEPELSKADPASHPKVFLKTLELLCRLLKGEEKFQFLMQLLREASNVNVPMDPDVRGAILMHVEDRKRLLKTLIEMYQQERDPALKASIKEILEYFDSFTRPRY
jgi:DNA-binding transcriptional regulator YhcF (GntR family)